MSLTQRSGSHLEDLKPIEINLAARFSWNLAHDVRAPYMNLDKIKGLPSLSGPNSGPAIMYSLSLVMPLRKALPISAAQRWSSCKKQQQRKCNDLRLCEYRTVDIIPFKLTKRMYGNFKLPYVISLLVEAKRLSGYAVLNNHPTIRNRLYVEDRHRSFTMDELHEPHYVSTETILPQTVPDP